MSETNSNVAILEKTETKIKIRKKYQVIMHNDKSTDFMVVLLILMEVFKKSKEEALKITEAIHKSGPTGKKVVAEYSSKNIADSKASKAMGMAKDFGYPDFKVTVK